MRIVTDASMMRNWAFEQRRQGKSIGLVPTMGALHAGHATLMKRAAEENDVAVVSIFVNPTQFAPHEDFDKYPRRFEDDCALAELCGVQAVYAPRATAMYPDGYATYVSVERVSQPMEGASRPHFFQGVATVVTKLFLAVSPDRAYFGQKDAQQCAVIRRMIADLDFGIEFVEVPTVREDDGLALSSRNQYLSADERTRALCLSRALFEGKRTIEAGERNVASLVARLEPMLSEVELDYLEVADADTMQPLERIEGRVLLAVAARVGVTRLIDNIKIEVTKTCC